MTTDRPSPLAPKLRFPEFRDASSWRVKRLNELLHEAKHRNRTLEHGPGDVLSVSGEYGCVNQIEFMGRSYAGVSVKDYHVVERGDIVYTKSPLKKQPYGIIKENKVRRGIVSTLYAVYRPLPGCSATYVDHYFSRDYNLNTYLQPIVKKGAKNDMKVNNADVLKGVICVPDLEEQQKIADCIGSLDDLIAAEAQKLKGLRQHKRGLMQQIFPQPGEDLPRFRFPKYRGHLAWETATVGDLVDTVAPPMKFTTSQYLASGRFPIIDQSQSYICGWTNDDEAVVTSPLPVIVFGEHTCALKFVDRPFAQGADGIKILTPKRSVTSVFLYHYLNCRPLESGEYKRHFSDLKEKEVSFPSIDSGEQHTIADCLTSIDDQLSSQSCKLDTLRQHKRGLLQQLIAGLGEESR